MDLSSLEGPPILDPRFTISSPRPNHTIPRLPVVTSQRLNAPTPARPVSADPDLQQPRSQSQSQSQNQTQNTRPQIRIITPSSSSTRPRSLDSRETYNRDDTGTRPRPRSLQPGRLYAPLPQAPINRNNPPQNQRRHDPTPNIPPQNRHVQLPLRQWRQQPQPQPQPRTRGQSQSQTHTQHQRQNTRPRNPNHLVWLDEQQIWVVTRENMVQRRRSRSVPPARGQEQQHQQQQSQPQPQSQSQFWPRLGIDPNNIPLPVHPPPPGTTGAAATTRDPATSNNNNSSNSFLEDTLTCENYDLPPSYENHYFDRVVAANPNSQSGSTTTTTTSRIQTGSQTAAVQPVFQPTRSPYAAFAGTGPGPGVTATAGNTGSRLGDRLGDTSSRWSAVARRVNRGSWGG